MKEKIRFILVNVLSIFMCLSFFQLFAYGVREEVPSAGKSAPLNPGFLEFIDQLKAGVNAVYGMESGASLPVSPVNLDHIKGRGGISSSTAQSYPARFDLREMNKLTPIRYQGDCASSWAFAAFASLESNLKPGENLDFSESHLIGNHGFDLDRCYGGNPWMAAAYLARWDGPLFEGDNNSSGERRHVQRIIFLPDRADSIDNDYIKYFISNAGAVFGRLYWDDEYYEVSQASYYSSMDMPLSLRVALVGWDDNYSRQNFKNIAPGDGAFIAKVSFGDWWGDNGYLYISYYDTGLSHFTLFNNAESTGNYDRIYQYDHLGWTQSRGYDGSTTAWGANIFTATSKQNLKAVSFYTTDTGTSYNIYIYKNISGNLPDEGTQAATISGNKSYPGYYTEKLPSAVSLSAGERFSVVIKFVNSAYGYPVPTEQPQDNYSSQARAELGQSFISRSGQGWYDLDTDNKNYNVCIKAFTDLEGGSVTLPEAPSFGSFDTPVNGASVRGSVAVTGWALDSSGLSAVKIYRKSGAALIYIGDAMFVEGARPDVAAAYPDYPNCTRAGWGYMLLSNFLPNQGNGSFELHAIAVDTGGRTTSLGSKTIYCDNANAIEPFGAIDTPAPGGIVSGSKYINWGWALTPQPNKIPVDGSTIDVVIDGVKIGHPKYNVYRSDIANLFPSYANSQGAIGYFVLDTTAYENGRHTIEWQVRDNAGNTQGIGSRFFFVDNENSGFTGELSDDIIDFTGQLGEPCVVAFEENGSMVEVDAFPGQVMVFFHPAPAVTTAHDAITGNGGYILAQVPAIGFYMVGVSHGEEGEYIRKIRTNSSVSLAVPHVVCQLDSNGVVIDECGDEHGNRVISLIKDCAELPDKEGDKNEVIKQMDVRCVPMVTQEPLSDEEYTAHFTTATDFFRQLDEFRDGPSLLNLSISADMPDCFNYVPQLSESEEPEETKKLLNNWYNAMKNTLEAVANLPDDIKKDFVLTASAGNNNMPIGDLLRKLRAKNDKYKEVLKNNVVIVTTRLELIKPKCPRSVLSYHANGWDILDDDIAIIDNPDAAGGSSFAAPCLNGKLHRLINLKNVSGMEALKRLKSAIRNNYNVLNDSVMNELLSIDGNYSGSYQVTMTGFECPLPKYEDDIEIKIENNQVSYTLFDYPVKYKNEYGSCKYKVFEDVEYEPKPLDNKGVLYTVDFSDGGVTRKMMLEVVNDTSMHGNVVYEAGAKKVTIIFSVTKSSWF